MATSDELDDQRVLASLSRILNEGAPYVAIPTVDPATDLFPDPTVEALRAELVDSGRLSESELSATFAPVTPTRRGFLAVSGGPNSPHSAVGGLTYRVPLTFPVNTTRWRVRWRNYNLTASTAYGVSNTFTGVYLGTPAYDAATGLPTGNYTAAPVQCIGSLATPADGSELVTPWVTDSDKQFVAFEPRLMSAGLLGGSGFNWGRSTGAVRYKVGTGTDVGLQTLTIAGTTPMYGDWRIEYEFEGASPVGLDVGDSLTEGQNSGDTPMSAHPQLFGLAARVSVASCAVSGIALSTLVGWASSHFFWTRFDLGAGWVPDYAKVWLGTNDIQSDRTTAQIKADFLTIFATLRGFGIKRIYVGLVAPRSFSAPRETIRQEVNAWLATLPTGISGVIDFDRALANPADLDSLDLKFDSGDATHLSARGQAKVAEAIPVSIGIPAGH